MSNAVVPSVDDSYMRLHLAGWSLADSAILSSARLVWLVTGKRGEYTIEALGTTKAEAWHQACQQAQGLGLLQDE
jgi:hypothetical protein